MTNTSRRRFAYLQKGQGSTELELAVEIATDITTFKDDYWFVLTGETFMRNQNIAHYAKCLQNYLYKKQLKHIQVI